MGSWWGFCVWKCCCATAETCHKLKFTKLTWEELGKSNLSSGRIFSIWLHPRQLISCKKRPILLHRGGKKYPCHKIWWRLKEIELNSQKFKQRGQVKFLHKVFISSPSAELQPAQQKLWCPITLVSNSVFSAAQFPQWWQKAFLNNFKKKKRKKPKKQTDRIPRLIQFNPAYPRVNKTKFFSVSALQGAPFQD